MGGDCRTDYGKMDKQEGNPLMREKAGAIVYAAIANPFSRKVLAEYQSSADKGNTSSQVVASSILPQLKGDEDPPGCCAGYGSMKIFYTTCEARVKGATARFTVIQVCTEDFPTQASITFQQQIAEDFTQFWPSMGSLDADRPCPKFVNTLCEKAKDFTAKPPVNAKTAAVMEQLDKVKDTVVQNLDEAMKRHGAIEIVMENSSTLVESSTEFAKGARSAKRKAQWNRIKFWICVAVAVLLGIGVLALVIWLYTKDD